jgi:hypothetical protein
LHASSSTEYVLTANGAYGYDASGALNAGQPYSLEQFLAELNEARRGGEKNSTEARARLNKFISQMDLLNEGLVSKEFFRAADVLDFTDDFNRTSPASM